MDDIQFWIYVIFAIIYFVARNFKKDKKKQVPGRPSQSDETTTNTQPQSFEELLEEITGRRSVTSQNNPDDRRISEAADPLEDPPKERYLEPKPWEVKEDEIQRTNDIAREGNNRKFADDESRRIYEESIKRAEGADIDYALDKKYANKKVIRSTAEEDETNELANEIKEMFQNADSARKAVIMSEIFNRKY
jgi:hypothetical protein